MSTPNNDQFPQYPGNGAGDPAQFQNQYAGANTNAVVTQPKHSGLAIAALVVGILGLLISWIPGLGFGLPFIGLILSIIALVLAKKNLNKKGLAITGLVLSVLGLLIAGFMTFLAASFLSGITENCDPESPDYEQCVQEYTNQKFGVEN